MKYLKLQVLLKSSGVAGIVVGHPFDTVKVNNGDQFYSE